MRYLLSLMLLCGTLQAATVVDDNLIGSLCGDGLVYVGGCPEAADLTGQGYFVDGTDGNDSNTGLSPAEAWRTTSKVSSTVSGTGPNVYLKSGTTMTGRLVVTWSGTEINKTVMGCYYMDSGLPYACSSSHPKAVIDGGNGSCMVNAWSCPYSSDPSGQNWTYVPMVEIRASHVQVFGIKVQNTMRHGFMVLGSGPTGPSGFTATPSHQYIEFTDIETNYTGWEPFVLASGIRYVAVKRALFLNYDHCHGQYYAYRDGRPGSAYASCDPGLGWAGGVASVWNGYAYQLFEDVVIAHGWGERFNMLGQSHVIMRSSEAYNGISGGFYSDAGSRWVVEGNVTSWHQGNIGTMYNNQSGSIFGGGIDQNYESYVPLNMPYGTNLIRGNLIIEGGNCITIGHGRYNVAGNVVSTRVIGNTMLGCKEGQTGVFLFMPESPTNLMSSNIIYSPSAPGCNSSVAMYQRNLWPYLQSDPQCRGTGDVFGVPNLATAYGQFLGTQYSRQRHLADAEMLAGSPGQNAGDPALTTQECIADGEFPAWITSKLENPPVDDLACWRKCLCYDGLGRRRSTTAPDMGALEQQ